MFVWLLVVSILSARAEGAITSKHLESPDEFYPSSFEVQLASGRHNELPFFVFGVKDQPFGSQDQVTMRLHACLDAQCGNVTTTAFNASGLDLILRGDGIRTVQSPNNNAIVVVSSSSGKVVTIACNGTCAQPVVTSHNVPAWRGSYCAATTSADGVVLASADADGLYVTLCGDDLCTSTSEWSTIESEDVADVEVQFDASGSLMMAYALTWDTVRVRACNDSVCSGSVYTDIAHVFINRTASYYSQEVREIRLLVDPLMVSYAYESSQTRFLATDCTTTPTLACDNSSHLSLATLTSSSMQRALQVIRDTGDLAPVIYSPLDQGNPEVTAPLGVRVWKCSSPTCADTVGPDQSQSFYPFGHGLRSLGATVSVWPANKFVLYAYTFNNTFVTVLDRVGTLTLPMCGAFAVEDCDDGSNTYLQELVEGAAQLRGVAASKCCKLRPWRYPECKVCDEQNCDTCLRSFVHLVDGLYSCSPVCTDNFRCDTCTDGQPAATTESTGTDADGQPAATTESTGTDADGQPAATTESTGTDAGECANVDDLIVLKNAIIEGSSSSAYRTCIECMSDRSACSGLDSNSTEADQRRCVCDDDAQSCGVPSDVCNDEASYANALLPALVLVSALLLL